MQVIVPYITVEQLDNVLSQLTASEVITTEQHAIISGEVEIRRSEMIRKSTEKKQANDLRQKCCRLAKKHASDTRRAIAR